MTLPLKPVENLPPELADQLVADAGRGVSSKPEDHLHPLIQILQTGSPACDKRGEGYVEGAEPGRFLLKGSVNPIRDELDVIPCGMRRVWTEWRPGRQGFVGSHDKRPADVEIQASKEGGYERELLVRSDTGNVLQDTREFYVLIDGAPFMLPCYGTKHTFARQWQAFMGQMRDPKTGVILPSYSRHYQLFTVRTSNALGHWFGLKFQDLGWITKAELSAARALTEIVERGAMRAIEDASRALPAA